MLFFHSFRIQPKDLVAFVGGGGKTTAMFRLADELVAAHRRVITTTTTRIFAAQIKLAPHHVKAPLLMVGEGGIKEGMGRFLPRVRKALASHPHTLIIGETSEGEKAFGVPPELVDELIALEEVDAVIYEADGSRMRPLKAPASHEPVLSARTTLLIPVVGISAIGEALDDKHVHRAEIVARLAGVRIADTVTPEIVARVLTHPEGGLKAKPSAARAIVLINQVESDPELASAREIARRALESSEVEAVAIGAVKQAASPIQEVHRRVAAIITAAGAGVRMQVADRKSRDPQRDPATPSGGRIKQLLPWRGKTLIENAIDIATHSNVSETIVVLGAHADEIRAVIRDPGVRVVMNPDWEKGHASSIRAALDAISPTVDAAIFINADQPFLTPAVVNAILQRYRETDAEIIAPTYGNKRGSPVLFRRLHFDELRSLRGEQGGRELLAKYADRIELVAFDDPRLGVDVDTWEEYERVLTLSI